MNRLISGSDIGAAKSAQDVPKAPARGSNGSGS